MIAWPILFAFSIGTIVIIVLFIFGKKNNAKVQEQFEILSKGLDLELFKTKSFFDGQKIQLKGDYKGLPIHIYEMTKNRGKQKAKFTVVQMECKDIDFKFTIGKENFLTKLGKYVGFKDIEFNDYELDKFFLFKSKDEDKFRALMNPQVMSELSRVKNDLNGGIVSQNQTIEYTVQIQLNTESKRISFENVIPVLEKIVSQKSNR